jgi:hypothetical protein
MKIKIEKPCHEDWSKMTSEAQGKFCNACEKSVVDFSMMSDAQILHYFSQPKTQKVCGRFNADQVDRALVNMIPERPSPPPQLLHFAYLLIVVLGVGLSSCSNTVTGKAEITEQQDSASPKMGKPVTKMVPAPNRYIKGKVKITKPPVITVDPIIEDHKIMGECVIPE